MHKKEIGFLIKLLSENIEKEANFYLKNSTLTLSQVRVLDYLHCKGGSSTQKDIENHLEVAHPTVVGILKRLELKKFVTCEFDAVDKRLKNIYVTKKAQPAHKLWTDFKKNMERRLLKGFSKEEAQQIKKLLEKACNNVN